MPSTLSDGRRLILASTSVFRRELLARLQLPFTAEAPVADETPQPGETAQQLAARLAEVKARSLAGEQPDALIIGADQVAELDGELMGKPGNHPRAVVQLTKAAGRSVNFVTGLCLLDAASGRNAVEIDLFRVHLRALSPEQIERYLQREQPYQCAGSFKSEGLGIALFERLEGDDPTSLIGLPLIRLTRLLAAEGVAVL